jgi:hypothetical protein
MVRRYIITTCKKKLWHIIFVDIDMTSIHISSYNSKPITSFEEINTEAFMIARLLGDSVRNL